MKKINKDILKRYEETNPDLGLYILIGCTVVLLVLIVGFIIGYGICSSLFI